MLQKTLERQTKALTLAPESTGFQGSLYNTDSFGSTRAWRNYTEDARQLDGAQDSTISQSDNKASGPGDKPFSTPLALHSFRSTSNHFRSENPCSPPSSLCLPCKSARQQAGLTSTEAPKVKNSNPTVHLIQRHLALLHASSRGNDRIGSSDLFDAGDWIPRSLQVHHPSSE